MVQREVHLTGDHALSLLSTTAILLTSSQLTQMLALNGMSNAVCRSSRPSLVYCPKKKKKKKEEGNEMQGNLDTCRSTWLAIPLQASTLSLKLALSAESMRSNLSLRLVVPQAMAPLTSRAIKVAGCKMLSHNCSRLQRKAMISIGADITHKKALHTVSHLCSCPNIPMRAPVSITPTAVCELICCFHGDRTAPRT